MTELPRASMYVTVGGLDWDKSNMPVRVSALNDRCLVLIGGLSFVCNVNTARRLYDALAAALPHD